MLKNFRCTALAIGLVALGLANPLPQAAAQNRCPTAVPMIVEVDAAPAVVNFQLSASDPDGDALQYSLVQGPAHGTVVLLGTGATTYSPSLGYCGPDTFKYTVTDGQCQSAEANVFVTVCPPPDRDGDDDGILDDVDHCSGTPAGAVVNAEGCAIVQLCPCENAWKNHGAYVSCVTHAAEDFVAKGLITAADKDATVAAASESTCGR